MSDEKSFRWLKVYTAEARNDTKLVTCSLASRAVAWLLSTLMSESEERGYLLVNGKKPDEKALANYLHTTLKHVRKALPELLEKGVFIEDERGVLCSPQMVRDHEKYLEASANGRKGGGNPALRVLPFDTKDADKGTDKGTYKGTSKLRGERREARDQSTSVLGARSTGTTALPSVPKHVFPRVPPPVHKEFLAKLGADDDPNDLIEFYERVTTKWKGQRIDETDFVFWRREWCEWRGTSSTRATKPAGRNIQTDGTVDGLRSFVRQMREGA